MAKKISKSLSAAVSAEIKSKFDLNKFKSSKGLDRNIKFKDQEWIPLSKAFQDVTSVPGIPMGHIVLLRGHSDTGKTTAVDGQSGMFAAMVPDRDGSSQKYAQILQDKIDACMSMSSAKMGAVATAIAVPLVPSDMIRGAQMSESSQKTPTERLTEAKKLLDAGLITQDMYEEKQRVILGEV